ncbi:hypothetical protein GC088_09970 [Arthrobacter sp. JZ12]|uniref:hypothetical protein n=1 Tax=Arthrobacter sp. JZ12 TaxID=2654190 RepID=UPI002B4A2130|nr:hypothetical protein [Arthrobacter sp. JZ12]WRH25355.1 hypothetical protein GC088_09970 [Arthrobacter sp. JZ12]
MAKQRVADGGADPVTQRLVKAIGSDNLAALLGVAAGSPGRWANGQDTPSEAVRLQLAEIDQLVDQLLTALTPAQARLWLVGQNIHLRGRPIDLYRLEGATPLIDALRAHQEGAAS